VWEQRISRYLLRTTEKKGVRLLSFFLSVALLYPLDYLPFSPTKKKKKVCKECCNGTKGRMKVTEEAS
jgi:hypothetical protein